MALEQRQAALLKLLRARAGAPVSFSELHAAGIEFPASVVSELELAGAPIERCVFHVGEATVTGVRLDPQREPADEHALTLEEAEPAPAPALAARPLRGRVSGAVWLAPVALLATAALLAALLPGGASSGRGAGVHRRASAFHARHAATSQTARASAREAAHTSVRVSTTPVSATLAIQLESHGHELLEGGRYGDAVQVLTSAVAATGEQPGDCIQPTSETCLTYAYALYDLGRALQLDGRAAAAVPVLQQRLQIDNQRPTVAYALESARAQSG